MKKQDITLGLFKRAIVLLNYKLPLNSLVTFGIRNNDMTAGIFNDFLGTYHTGSDEIKVHTGTVDPGSFYMNNPINPKGTAVMKSGHYPQSYILGLHKGYKALRQDKNIPFYRITKTAWEADNKGVPKGQWKIILKDKPIEVAKIGANQHRASAVNTSTDVGQWSAACQVRNNPKEYDEFIKDCEDSKQKYFDYILFTEKELFFVQDFKSRLI
jgi:hypothetical protein